MEQHIWLEGREGKHISTVVHSPNDAEVKNYPAVIYCHGFTGNKIGDNQMGVKLARYLCEQEYVVVRFDFIGSGESEGRFEHDTYVTGWLEDLKTVLSFTKTLVQVDPQKIVTIGHSLGGAIVTQTGDLDGQIHAVCALAPVSYPEENFSQIILGPERWAQAIEGKTVKNFYNKFFALSPGFVSDLVQYKPLEKAAELGIPVLIIHGKEDKAVPHEHSYDLLNALKTENKQLLILDDEPHLMTEQIHEPIVQWLNKIVG